MAAAVSVLWVVVRGHGSRGANSNPLGGFYVQLSTDYYSTTATASVCLPNVAPLNSSSSPAAATVCISSRRWRHSFVLLASSPDDDDDDDGPVCIVIPMVKYGARNAYVYYMNSINYCRRNSMDKRDMLMTGSRVDRSTDTRIVIIGINSTAIT